MEVGKRYYYYPTTHMIGYPDGTGPGYFSGSLEGDIKKYRGMIVQVTHVRDEDNSWIDGFFVEPSAPSGVFVPQCLRPVKKEVKNKPGLKS